MTRADLQRLTLARLQDAENLFNARRYSGAYHFAGLAVECAIKACIAKRTKRFEFADLQSLLEEERAQNPGFDQNWSIIIKWRIDSRYDLSNGRQAASLLIASITQQPDGVLPWLQVYW